MLETRYDNKLSICIIKHISKRHLVFLRMLSTTGSRAPFPLGRWGLCGGLSEVDDGLLLLLLSYPLLHITDADCGALTQKRERVRGSGKGEGGKSASEAAGEKGTVI